MDKSDEVYNWLVEHLHDCMKKAQSSKTTKRRVSPDLTLDAFNVSNMLTKQSDVHIQQSPSTP
ncbi:hypothetical protein NECAME_08736 [Necator americanus]|uniref:Uncharacterized protein n=1 Tax=Necator americanus TaxID=51031 RepID=W2THJ6_NECAM|nr:hypothetical protein NECAME_08736 [Necator americanus]ETN81074.1 hypothetical protein NECAME_08736 [Necator americanus]